MYSYYFSWYIFYSIVLFIYSVVWTLISKRPMAPDANIVLYFLLYFLSGQYFLCLAILIASLFSRAKPGVLTAIICYLVLFGVATANDSISPEEVSTNTIYALSPIAGLRMSCDMMLLVQSFYQSFGFGLFSETILGFKYSVWFWITLIKSVVFYLLAIYLDQVWPKETGVAKHPLFCFMKKQKRRTPLNRVSASKDQNQTVLVSFFLIKLTFRMATTK